MSHDSYQPSSPAPNPAPSADPSPTTRATPRRPRRRSWWIIGAVIVLLFAALAANAFFSFQARSTPEKSLAILCDAWTTGNWQEGAALHSTTLYLTKMAWVNTHFFARAKTCQASNIQINGSTATATLTVTLEGDTKPVSAPAYLVLEKDTWKIEFFPTG